MWEDKCLSMWMRVQGVISAHSSSPLFGLSSVKRLFMAARTIGRVERGGKRGEDLKEGKKKKKKGSDVGKRGVE